MTNARDDELDDGALNSIVGGAGAATTVRTKLEDWSHMPVGGMEHAGDHGSVASSHDAPKSEHAGENKAHDTIDGALHGHKVGHETPEQKAHDKLEAAEQKLHHKIDGVLHGLKDENEMPGKASGAEPKLNAPADKHHTP